MKLPEDIVLLAQRNKRNSKGGLQIRNSQNILRIDKSFGGYPLKGLIYEGSGECGVSLVIVEQLSTVVEWDAIIMYLPKSNNGSRIIVATQQLGLALSLHG